MNPPYADRYRTIHMRREDGVLELAIHCEGGSARWGFWGGLHRELGEAFHEIAYDPDNRVLVLTGTGEDFCAEFDLAGEQPPPMSPETWDIIFREGRALLENLIAIEIPVIAAVHGKAFIHAEIALLSDIVIASHSAVFADKAHCVAGVVPGDGVQTIWPMLLGPNRGRYFLLTGQEIGASEALLLGLVGEVVAEADLLARAWEHARTLAGRPPLAMRYTRLALVSQFRDRLPRDLGYGLMLEGIGVLDRHAGP